MLVKFPFMPIKVVKSYKFLTCNSCFSASHAGLLVRGVCLSKSGQECMFVSPP